jgi:hypothetical protein
MIKIGPTWSLANEKGQFHPPFTYVVNLVMFRVKLLFVFPTEKLAIPITDVRKFQLFAVLTLDVIWLSRNKLIHEDIQPDPFKVSQQLHAFLGSHLLAWKNASLPSLWLSPCVGNVKGNFDVAIRGNFAVAASVLRDSSGEIFAAATLKP